MVRNDPGPDTSSIVSFRLLLVTNSTKFNPNQFKYKRHLLAHIFKKSRARSGMRYCWNQGSHHDIRHWFISISPFYLLLCWLHSHWKSLLTLAGWLPVCQASHPFGSMSNRKRALLWSKSEKKFCGISSVQKRHLTVSMVWILPSLPISSFNCDVT